MPIYRALLFILFVSLSTGQLHAENGVQKLGNFLDKLGKGIQRGVKDTVRGVERDLERIDDSLSRSNNSSVARNQQKITGNCLTYSRRGLKTDDEFCTRIKKCRRRNKCSYEYIWPSGSKTVVELNRRGKARRMNGNRAKVGKFKGRECLQNSRSKNIFCFIEDEPVDIVQTQEPVIMEDHNTQDIGESNNPTDVQEFQNSKPATSSVIADNPKTSINQTPQVRNTVGEIPTSGVYYYSGILQCNKNKERLIARVEVKRQYRIQLGVAMRSIDNSGKPRRYGNRAFKMYEGVAEKGKGLMRFSTRARNSGIFADAAFSKNGDQFFGEWLDRNQRKQRACGSFSLSKIGTPVQSYKKITKLLTKKNPTSDEAIQLGQFERNRAPIKWALKDGLSNDLRTYDRQYKGFWQRFYDSEVKQISKMPFKTAFERKEVRVRIAIITQIAKQGSGNFTNALEAEYRLISALADNQYTAGMAVERYRYSDIKQACIRASVIGNRKRNGDLGYMFAHPLEYWSERDRDAFISIAGQCAQRYPRRRKFFDKAYAYLQTRPNVISPAKNNAIWLKEQSDRVLAIPVGIRSLAESDDYSILKGERKRRGIEDAQYERLFLNRISTARKKAIKAAKIEIDTFFANATVHTLNLADADTACEKKLLGGFDKRAVRGRKDNVLQALNKHCNARAKKYGKRMALFEADRQAEIVLALPATYQSLKSNNWFRHNLSDRNSTLGRNAQPAINRYDARIGEHYKRALRHAQVFLNNTFVKAIPFESSEKAAIGECALSNSPPYDLVRYCKSLMVKFARRKVVARCSKATKLFDAPDEVLDTDIIISKKAQKIFSIRRMVCASSKNRPEIKSKYVAGSILSSPQIQLLDKQSKILLEVTIGKRKLVDNRNILEYLTDIASGANEERAVDNTFEVKSIDSIDKTRVINTPPAEILGCVLGFSSC